MGGSFALGWLEFGGWSYSFVLCELPTFLQSNLPSALGGPLKVGGFEHFSPTGVRLGSSTVLPTEDDFSWVEARPWR